MGQCIFCVGTNGRFQCKANAEPGSDYCAYHIGPPAIKQPPSPGEEVLAGLRALAETAQRNGREGSRARYLAAIEMISMDLDLCPHCGRCRGA